MIECDLCGMQFSELDSLIKIRMERHEKFHATARIQRRNTTQGKVEWIKK